MLDKIIKTLILTVSLLFCLSGGVSAADVVELNQLVENAEAMDGQTVTVTGEAIGEAMERGDHAWVNINDGTNAMGIWMPLDDAQRIKFFGDYKHIGDQLQVTGVFNQACAQHGGDVDIHSNSITVIEAGYVTEESVSSPKIIIGFVLVFLASVLGFIYLKIIKKSDG
ncbi:hypothetical protein [Acetobacterium sp.]|uniref:hypothetical protein n=1 Tax=Acetobacterium sp. TaxID=1872094 RepID=UPI002726BCFB|nr:hypothetical protein [Acetobacterium sp.]MDO9492398.1 hypothetical protein [Acetobacterium sp.]